MNSGRRYLFERLAGIGADSFDPREAVAHQVRRMVDTIPMEDPDEALAEGAHLLNFGLPPVVDLGFSTPAERDLYADHLRNLLRRFEPRLGNPKVAFSGALGNTPGGPNPIGIDITARLDAGTEDEIIRFHVDANGLTGG